MIEIRPEGDGATVRFTRRDRFRDPTGRIVTQESPPIEKRVVRASDGLRFEPGSADADAAETAPSARPGGRAR